MELGSALIIGTIALGAYIHQLLQRYTRWKRLKNREKQFFNRNPYATVLYRTLESNANRGESTKWV
ncbi:MAG: hypothetical protein ACLFPS_09670 [Clostridia bacterium]